MDGHVNPRRMKTLTCFVSGWVVNVVPPSRQSFDPALHHRDIDPVLPGEVYVDEAGELVAGYCWSGVCVSP